MRSALKRRHGFPYKRRWASTFVGGEIPSITFPSSVLQTRVYIALGADLTASWLTWNWLDITDRCRHDLGITVAVGRLDEFSQVTPSRCTIKLDNNDGYLVRRNVFSPYYGLLTKNTPIWIQIDAGSGFTDRYHGFVNEWPTTWADESGSDAFVTIQCSGVLRRLAQRTKPLTSTLRRTVMTYSPAAYWPMDDGDDIDRFASAVGGTEWPTINRIGDDSDLPGSDSSLPVITFQIGSVYVPLAAYTDTGRWSVFACMKPIHEGLNEEAILVAVASDDYKYQIVLGGTSGTVFGLYVFDPSASLIASPTVAVSSLTDQWWTVSVTSSSTDTLTATLYDTAGNLVASISQSNPGTHQRLTHLRAAGFEPEAAAYGHVLAITDASLNLTDFAEAYSRAAGGFVGEMAHVRMRRLCLEENVPFHCVSAVSAAMGPQGSGGLLSLLREGETADQGVLYEHEFGLAYQSLDERYNAAVTLELDFDQAHHAGIAQPTDDDQRLVNRFTATRSGGNIPITAEVTTGTLGTGAGGSGVYDDSATVNVEIDDQLDDYASWRVHLGTIDEDRWPRIPFRLHASPELIPSWLATPFGARVNVANPPSPMNQDTIDAVIEGHAERWDEVSWDVALATSPASAYTVFVVEDDELGRLDSGSSILAASYSSGTTSLSVATSNALDLWTTTETPLDVTISGITVNVSAISGASSPQAFTVTGVTKDLSAGAVVELADAGVLGI